MTIRVKQSNQEETLVCKTCGTDDALQPNVKRTSSTPGAPATVTVSFVCNNGKHTSNYSFTDHGDVEVMTVRAG